MQTFLIKNSDVEQVINMEFCLKTAEMAFNIYDTKNYLMPAKSLLSMEDHNGEYQGMLSYIPSIPIAGMKAANFHPNNPLNKMITVMAVIILINPYNGFPMAIMDGTLITNMRTGAAGGVATKYLANDVVETIGFVGAGTQAKAQLDALMIVRPMIEKLKIYDIYPQKSQLFKEYCNSKYSVEVDIADDVYDAVYDCNIVSTTTSSRTPLFGESSISPGTHINAMGADTEGKQEISPHVLKKAILVVDDWNQSCTIGELNVPYNMGELTRNDVDAVLSEILTGKRLGRRYKDDITVFDSSGLALQDVMTAWNVYQLLMENDEYRDKLTTIDFLE